MRGASRGGVRAGPTGGRPSPATPGPGNRAPTGAEHSTAPGGPGRGHGSPCPGARGRPRSVGAAPRSQVARGLRRRPARVVATSGHAVVVDAGGRVRRHDERGVDGALARAPVGANADRSDRSPRRARSIVTDDAGDGRVVGSGRARDEGRSDPRSGQGRRPRTRGRRGARRRARRTPTPNLQPAGGMEFGAASDAGARRPQPSLSDEPLSVAAPAGSPPPAPASPEPGFSSSGGTSMAFLHSG